MKTNVASTSIKCYREITSEGLIISQDALILLTMTRQQFPLNSRQLTILSGQERTSVIRSLYNLIKASRIQISHKGTCPITGRRVSYYSLIANDQGSIQ